IRATRGARPALRTAVIGAPVSNTAAAGEITTFPTAVLPAIDDTTGGGAMADVGGRMSGGPDGCCEDASQLVRVTGQVIAAQDHAALDYSLPAAGTVSSTRPTHIRCG
ncbi:MAG: hypothetical protein M4D85_05760, partial [Actinomycetota bacterium]|nr:hypothetical protein [Actinomycetota bacterium]